MRKKLKTILSVILALAMVACMAVPALAEGNIIIYNGTSGPQQGQPGPGPGPQGPQQGPGPAPQGPAPKKSNSNYDYAVLKGNTGKYNYKGLSSSYTNMYMNVSSGFENPEKGKVTLTVFGAEPTVDGLFVQLNVRNGLDQSITVKRLDRLLLTKDGEVIAKVPHQLVDENTKVDSDRNGTVSFTIDPQYFNHNAKLRGGTISVEAELIYD